MHMILEMCNEKKRRMPSKRRSGLWVSLAIKTRRRTDELFWLCVHCVHFVKEETHKESLHITFLHELQELKIICCWFSDHIYKVMKITEYFGRLIESFFSCSVYFHGEHWGIHWYHRFCKLLDQVSHKPMSL